jgi:hypothetical protein
VEKPLQQREKKTLSASQQNFTISKVFTKRQGLSYNMINP